MKILKITGLVLSVLGMPCITWGNGSPRFYSICELDSHGADFDGQRVRLRAKLYSDPYDTGTFLQDPTCGATISWDEPSLAKTDRSILDLDRQLKRAEFIPPP